MPDEAPRKRSRFDQTEPARKPSRFDRRSRSPPARDSDAKRSRSPLARESKSPGRNDNAKSPLDAAAAAGSYIATK